MADMDTQAKRFSTLNWGFVDRLLMAPTGAVDEAGREHFLGLYAGIGAAAASNGWALFSPLHNRRRRAIVMLLLLLMVA